MLILGMFLFLVAIAMYCFGIEDFKYLFKWVCLNIKGIWKNLMKWLCFVWMRWVLRQPGTPVPLS